MCAGVVVEDLAGAPGDDKGGDQVTREQIRGNHLPD